jgi:GTP-binding protein
VSSASGRDPVHDYDVIARELALFPGRDASGEQLQDKPVIVAANKIDALDDPGRLEALRAHAHGHKIPFFPISAATGEGITPLVEAVWAEIASNAGGSDADVVASGGSGSAGSR